LAPIPSAQADTEAEIASETQRPLTDAEYNRLLTDCRLELSGEALEGFPSDLTVTRITLAEQRFLPLITIYSDPDDPSENNSFISAYDTLPKGGIGRRDFCAMTQVGKIPEPGSRIVHIIVALRLRPGLDIERDYPTVFAQIRERGQFMRLPASGFALIDVSAIEDRDALVVRIANNSMLDRESVYLVIDDHLLMPLRD